MLEERWFVLADRLAASVCRRRRLSREAEEDFRSYVRVRLAERGEQILSGHDSRSSSVDTYLLVVLDRMRCDWQRAEWGVWRPSREAQRLGTVAVELERLTGRDGVPFDQAASELRARFGESASRPELERIAARLPRRVRQRKVSEEALEEHAAPGGAAQESVDERERLEVAARVGPLLQRAVGSLEPLDSLVLVLVFREGLSVRAAARGLGIDHKKVGRRLERVLERLREVLERGGVDRHGVLLLLEGPLPGQEGWLPAGDAGAPKEWDRTPARPSSPEGAEP